MTQDEIIEIAEKSGVAFSSDEYPDIWQTYMDVGKEELEAFAKLVQQKAFLEGYNRCLEDNQAIISLHVDTAVAAEREACAKVCESFKTGNSATYIDDDWADMCADAIRARGVQ